MTFACKPTMICSYRTLTLCEQQQKRKARNVARVPSVGRQGMQVHLSTKKANAANVANATTAKPKAFTETVVSSPVADTTNVIEVPKDSEHINDSSYSKDSNGTVTFSDFNTSDVTSSFDRLKVIYKKIGDNESQAFGVWQQLSESERTAAFVHTQRIQGDLSSRSYLYVYLRDKEWTKATSPATQQGDIS